jgi:hypothetical protein
MNTLYPIQELRETGNPEDANELLADGWKLLGVFQRAKVNGDGDREAWALYVLGMGGPLREPNNIDRVREVREDEANDALRKGAVLLKVITRKGEEDEYPCFIIGRPRADDPAAKEQPQNSNGHSTH